MKVDLTKTLPNAKFRLRNGETWQFLYLGASSKNVAIGMITGGWNVRDICLFSTTGHYRMDDIEHELDIVELLP